MNTIKLRRNRSMTIVFYLFVAIFWIVDLALLFISITGESEYLLHALLFVLFAILLTVAVRTVTRWKLVFDEEGVTYTPMIGRAKKLAYREISRITIGQGYVIYDPASSKWASFADDSPNALQAIDLMKTKGVKVDLF